MTNPTTPIDVYHHHTHKQVIGFLKTYGLEEHFKINIEVRRLPSI